MRTSGRSTVGKPGLAFVFLVALAGVALATETWVADVPAGDAYVVAASWSLALPARMSWLTTGGKITSTSESASAPT